MKRLSDTKSGVKTAFDVAAFLPIVRKQAHRLARGDHFTREDLVQEGIIAVLKAMDTYDPERGSLPAYVSICARNRMISYLRRGRHESPMEAEVLEATATASLGGYRTEPPQESLERRETLAALVKNLSDFERSVLRAYLAGGRVSATAKTLGCDRKRVDNALQRIRNKARNR